MQFERKVLAGTATLQFERVSANALVLDTRDLKIDKAETASDGNTFAPAQFEVGKSDPILGAPLTIRLPPGATRVRIHYSTAPAPPHSSGWSRRRRPARNIHSCTRNRRPSTREAGFRCRIRPACG